MKDIFVVKVNCDNNEPYEDHCHKDFNLFAVEDINDATKWISDESNLLNYLLEHDRVRYFGCGRDHIKDSKFIKYKFELDNSVVGYTKSIIVITDYFDEEIEQWEPTEWSCEYRTFTFIIDKISIMNGGDING